MKPGLTAAALAAAIGVAAAGHAMNNDDYRSRHEQIRAEQRAALQKCNSLPGNARDICAAWARGAAQIARAELDAYRRNYTPETRRGLLIARARAAHDVAKERCDELAGNARDVCLKDARARLIRARAEAESGRPADDSAQAPRMHVAGIARPAEYDTALERCNAYAGAAKDRCVADARARFGAR